jgi:hypothetical protein
MSDVDLGSAILGAILETLLLTFVGFSVSLLIFQLISFLVPRRKPPVFRSILLILLSSIGFGFVFSTVYLFSLALPLLALIEIAVVVGIIYRCHTEYCVRMRLHR